MLDEKFSAPPARNVGDKKKREIRRPAFIWANYSDQPAGVTPNGGELVRESSPQNPLIIQV